MSQHLYKKICAVGLMLAPLTLWANMPVSNNDSVKDSIPIELFYSNFDRNLDSLMRMWHVQQVIASNPLIEEIEEDLTPLILEYHDSIYIQRLEKIPSLINLTYNNVVRSCIHVYTVRKREQMEVMLGLSEYYFPMFEEIFDMYEMPLEIKYLAVVESALNPIARSRAGATGIWQFMLATGRQYNLPVTTFVDMRRDPVAATHAAAKYLKDLYNIYNDWTLAMAAYNCGPGNVNRAIRRSGGKTSYWDIYPYLPRETRMYVPLYIGATYTMNYYREHGFTPRYVDVPSVSDTIMVNRNINLAQVSEIMDIPLRLLRDLNPQYLRDIIPGNSAPHPLRLPIASATAYIDMEETIANHKANVYLSNSFRVVNPSGASATSQPVNIAGRDRVVHTILKDESLSTIAVRYGVTVNNLRDWNNISGSRIIAGRTLVVYPRQTASAQSARATTAPPQTASAAGSENVIYHTVKSGDTVWGIARQYQGISDSDILKWNNLSKNSVIKPGMKLKILQ